MQKPRLCNIPMMMTRGARMKLRRMRSFLLCFVLAGVLYISVNVHQTRQALHTRATQMRRLFESMDDQNVFSDVNNNTQLEQACVLPNLPLWNERMFYAAYSEPCKKVVCKEEEDWVYTANGNFHTSARARQRYGSIDCSYIPIVCENDDNKLLPIVEHVETGSSLTADAMHVTCTSSSGHRYENIHASISISESDSRRNNGKGYKQRGVDSPPQYNVIILGLDSMSRFAYKRFLPKSYTYFTRELGGVVLEGFNIVGDGTTQALMPMLTGKNETDVPEVRRGHANAIHVDVATKFVWTKFEEHGYKTLWAEDHQEYATFHYRLMGFKNQPTLHYMRPFQLYVKDKYKNANCFGSKSKYQLFIDWLIEAMDSYKKLNFPVFGLGFHSEITHNDNACAVQAETDTLRFLQYFKDSGLAENTFLFLMGDHGLRTGPIRQTEQGKLEERMPFMGISVPSNFRELNPSKYETLRQNIKRLTTPFDIYGTLLEILGDKTLKGKGRSNSLFTPISLERTCKDAGIEPHWCACLKWESISVSDSDAIACAKTAVDSFNSFLNKSRSVCHTLSLTRLVSAKRQVTNVNVLKFKNSLDMDGRVPDMGDKTQTGNRFFQISIETQPGGGLFEITSSIDVLTNEIRIDRRAISRTNLYGDAPKCVQDQYPELRPFCVCK